MPAQTPNEMAPANTKANYKSYEAQARMVRAIVAAHPDVKWNYKEITACYGSDMTEHALNHRFRRLRAQALIVHEARRVGLDIKEMMAPDDLPNTKEAVDKNSTPFVPLVPFPMPVSVPPFASPHLRALRPSGLHSADLVADIAKYFGQSTPDGIQFQFRGIKHDADKLRAVEAAGGDVANCLQGGGRIRYDVDKDDDDADGPVENWSDRDETPSKRAKPAPASRGVVAGQKTATPRRAAAIKAKLTIADVAAAQLQGSVSPPPVEASSDPYMGSFMGSPDQKTAAPRTPCRAGGSFADGLWSSAMNMDDGYGDGEI
ncbi:hypothetical protein OCS_03315 [Ophiocordyceps sinensis CO18]|uniref:Uncharacterized protein n=1 Tax=Ophiocordyceps sinensis (strain Co18 / CGMCC 3.14243) TaxID=911162 RepID=T5AGM1_OPHSC|nr:hypothetical protein OCS_03315 [Ophiocordyceps sinensis CO18]